MNTIQIKDSIEQLNRTIHQFKKNNDLRLDEIETKGGIDPLLEEKVDKANAAISTIEQQIKNFMIVAARPGASSDRIDDTVTSKAFEKYLRFGDFSELKSKAMSVGSDSDGGYAVPEQLDSNLENFLYAANVMRRLASVVKATTSDYKIAVNTGGLAAGWVGETDSRPNTATPQIEEITPPTGELYANPAASGWMIDDAGFNLESWLMTEIQNKFSSMEGGAFISGSGVKQPKGILRYSSTTAEDDTRPFGTLKHLEAASATSFTADEIITFFYDLASVYRGQSAFVANSKTVAFLRKLKDSNGQYLWQQSLSADQPAMLLGQRLEIDENMPNIAAEAVPVMFGNFAQGYRIIDRTPLRVLRDEFTLKPFVQFYSTKRVSGIVHDSKAIRLLKMKA